MAKRGFLAELQYQNQQAAKRAAQAQRAAVRQHNAQVRAAQQAQRAAAADAKQAAKEAKQARVEEMQFQAEELNDELSTIYAEIDGLLAETLKVDDYVDLEGLRETVDHPPFDRADLENPIPEAPKLVPPAEPKYSEPAAPTGLGGLFGGKGRHAKQIATATQAFESARRSWETEMATLPARQQKLDEEAKQLEIERQETLAKERARYDAECSARQQLVDDSNAKLDELIAGLNYNVEDAIQEYVSIVLGNSVYPDSFPVDHDFKYESGTGELSVTVNVPAPTEVPSIKAYSYNKSKDEIVSTSLPQKDQKERYTNAIEQTALRTIHEIFEADRSARIKTISVVVSTETISAATGKLTDIPLVAVACDRKSFIEIDLSYVVPRATLELLNAVISKNPFALTPIDLSKGVRG